jgi:iron complex outermembrane receptor protein
VGDAAQGDDASGGIGSGETALGPVNGVVATRSATGSKTDTPILEIPRTVDVVTQDEITQQQAQNVSQALRYVPGVTLEKFSASGIFETYVVRGFEAPQFLDGLPLPSESTLTFARPYVDPYMLERIEVLKGPASALYGQVPPGGLINMVSKRPTFSPHNEVFFTTGSFERAQAGFDIGAPDPSGKFAYRLIGMGRTTDLQMDHTEDNRFFIAPSFTFRPNLDTELTILAAYGQNGGYGPQQYVPYELTRRSAPFGRLPYSRYLGQENYDGYDQEQGWIGYAFRHRFNDVFEFRQNLRYEHVNMDLQALRTEGLLRDAAGTIVDFRTVNRSANVVASKINNFGVDNQLEAQFATGPLEHTMLFGIDYQDATGFGKYAFGFAPPIDAYAPVYDLPMPPNSALLPIVNSDNDTDQLGFYAQDQIRLNRWILTIGGRHDEANATVVDPTPGRPPRVDLNDKAWTGFAGVNYIFDSGLAPYASVSSSFQPVSGFTLVDETGEPLEPTTGKGWETGIKYQPPGTRVLLTAAYFDIAQSNVAKPSADFAFIEQAGEVRVKGYELEGKASLNDSLDLIAGYSNFSAILTDDTNPLVIGNVFPNVAQETASLWAMYTFHQGIIAGLGLGGGVRYTGPQFIDDANTVETAGYTLMDAALAYDFSYMAPRLEGLELRINVANVFNKFYVASCVTSTVYCGLGAERTILTTLAYRW